MRALMLLLKIRPIQLSNRSISRKLPTLTSIDTRINHRVSIKRTFIWVRQRYNFIFISINSVPSDLAVIDNKIRLTLDVRTYSYDKRV